MPLSTEAQRILRQESKEVISNVANISTLAVVPALGLVSGDTGKRTADN